MWLRRVNFFVTKIKSRSQRCFIFTRSCFRILKWTVWRSLVYHISCTITQTERNWINSFLDKRKRLPYCVTRSLCLPMIKNIIVFFDMVKFDHTFNQWTHSIPHYFYLSSTATWPENVTTCTVKNGYRNRT